MSDFQIIGAKPDTGELPEIVETRITGIADTRSKSVSIGKDVAPLYADDFGCVGDGITDDTQALTALYAAAAARAKSNSVFSATTQIVFRAGRYIDSLNRVFNFRLQIVGEGKLMTTLFRKNGSSGDFLTFGNQYSSISNITVDGNRVNCPDAGDNLVFNSNRIAAKDVLIRNAKKNGITVGKTVSGLGWELLNVTISRNSGYGVHVSGLFGSTDGIWLGGDVGQSGLSGVRLSGNAQNLTLVHSWGNGLESATDNHGFYVDSTGNQLTEIQGETNLGSGLYVEGAENHGNRITGKFWGNGKSGIKIKDATKGFVSASIYRNASLNSSLAQTAEYAGIHNIDGRQWSFSAANVWDDSGSIPAGNYPQSLGDPGNYGYVPSFTFGGRAAARQQSYGYAEETAGGAGPEHNAFGACVIRKEDTLADSAFLIISTVNRMSAQSNNFGNSAIPGRSIVSGVLRCPPEADTVYVTSNAVLSTMTGGYAGRKCTLIWSASAPAQVTHGTGTNGIYLSAAQNWTPNRWSTMTVVYDGSRWFEISRTNG